MKPFNNRYRNYLLVIGFCIVAWGCSRAVIPITDANKASIPVITINGFPDGGSIEKNNQTDNATINADFGMGISISGSAKDIGGMLNFSVNIVKNGITVFNVVSSSAPDMNGKVPDQLTILGTNNSGGIGNTPMKFIMDQVTDVIVSATNYGGKARTFTLHYIPVAASLRGKNITQTVTLVKDNLLNIFTASFPTFQSNGTLVALNGGPRDVYLLKPTNRIPFNCIDPAATIRLQAFGNLFPSDYRQLFGMEHPSLPLDLKACALGPLANSEQVTLQLTYKLN